MCFCCPEQVHIQTLQSLAPATVLQKLCLFNCKLDQEAAEQLVASLEAGGFSNLQELDVTGNDIEAAQMQALLQSLEHQDRAPALKVIHWLSDTAVIMCESCNSWMLCWPTSFAGANPPLEDCYYQLSCLSQACSQCGYESVARSKSL